MYFDTFCTTTEGIKRGQHHISVFVSCCYKVVCPHQSPSVDSLGTAERAEYRVPSHPQTFPRGLAPDYRAVGATLGRRGKTLFAPQASFTPSRQVQNATAVFGRAGGRLVVPNTGEHRHKRAVCSCLSGENSTLSVKKI